MPRAARLLGPLLVLVTALAAIAPVRAAEPVVVTMWTWRPDAPVVAKMVAAIRHAHPDIDLRAVVQPADTYFAALAAAAQSRILPDIIGLPAGAETQRLRGQLQDLSTPADSILGKHWREHFAAEPLAEAGLGNPEGDDTLYMLPMTAEVLGLWYDRGAFAKAGVGGPPESLDAMAADAAKLRKSGLSPLALAGKDDASLIGLFLQMVAQTDPQDVLDAEGGKPVWSHPGMIRTATAWQVVFGEIAGPAALKTDTATARGEFAQGKAAMSAFGSSWLHEARVPGQTLTKYGEFAFPPIAPDKQPSPALGGVDVGWAVTANASITPEIERASHIVLRDLLVGVGAQVAIDELSGLPAWTDMVPHEPLPADVRRLYDSLRARLGTARPHVIGDPSIHDALAANLRKIATGAESPGAAMAAVDAAARKQVILAR